ncbi:GDP-L-fucose synthase [Oceanicella sp. SM1341]|uniref:GDP-L-fucose synthase family protein n=1 Tax=Oceanicella sp. SM1341 TaxID=1548889 RepID=UPI000E52B249|nr:GDP-L-fucose synthase [Oceanicella sp. SM1341]
MSAPRLFSHRGRRVFVAGHRGLAGAALLRRLAREDCTLLTADHAELDLTRQEQVERWFARNRPEVVYLAAATAGGIHANHERPADFIYDNLAIQTAVIRAAHLGGVAKLCFLGSSCIYPRLAPQPMREEALLTGPLDPHNIWYAVAKIAGLMLVDGFARQHGCDFISVMPANLYGPGDKFTPQNSHVVAALIDRIHRAREAGLPRVEIWGTGSARREFLHCDDMADACVFLMERYSSPEIVNIGTGQDSTILELARTIAGVIGFHGALVCDPTRPDGMPRKVVDVSRLGALGWHAPTRFRDGLAQTYAWYLEHVAGARDPSLARG